MNISEIFPPILLNLLSAAIYGFIGWCLYRVYYWYVTRYERWFWGRFYKRKLHIVFREYRIDASTPEEDHAYNVGDGYQVSKGMAMAMGRLISYCQENVSNPELIKVTGDKTNSFDSETESPICLGSKTNNLTERYFHEIGETYTLPFDTEWDSLKSQVVIKYLNSPFTEFRPSITDGNGKDYALIISADLLNGPALIIAGAHMWGTQAGVYAITNRRWLKELRRKFSRSNNYAFVLEITIENGMPRASSIVKAVNLGEYI